MTNNTFATDTAILKEHLNVTNDRYFGHILRVEADGIAFSLIFHEKPKPGYSMYMDMKWYTLNNCHRSIRDYISKDELANCQLDTNAHGMNLVRRIQEFIESVKPTVAKADAIHRANEAKEPEKIQYLISLQEILNSSGYKTTRSNVDLSFRKDDIAGTVTTLFGTNVSLNMGWNDKDKITALILSLSA